MAALNWVDWAILALILVSGGFGAMAGFIKEFLGLVIWLIAGVISWRYASVLAVELAPWLELESTRVMAAAGILFMLTLLVGGLVSHLLNLLVQATGLKGTDRFMGLIFGILRGLCILVILAGILRLAPVQNDPWWRQSVLLPELTRVADWAMARLPELFSQGKSRITGQSGQ